MLVYIVAFAVSAKPQFIPLYGLHIPVGHDADGALVDMARLKWLYDQK